MEGSQTSRKRKQREFELDLVENAILEEIGTYFQENDGSDEEYRTALKRFRQELEEDFDDYREKLVESITLKKNLKKVQEQQKAMRLSTLEAKKERTEVQQDLYELEMSQFVGNQERLALEGLNDFFVDLDVSLKEANADLTAPDPQKRKNRLNDKTTNQEKKMESIAIRSANYDATLIDSSRVVSQIVGLKALADRLEQMEELVSRLPSAQS